MDNTINLGLTGEQMALLSEMIEECVKELRETNESMARRDLEMESVRAEMNATIARLQERAERGWNVETVF